MIDFILKYWIQELFALILAVLTWLWRTLLRRKQENDEIKEGMMALLHDRIYQLPGDGALRRTGATSSTCTSHTRPSVAMAPGSPCTRSVWNCRLRQTEIKRRRNDLWTLELQVWRQSQ